MIPEGWEIAAVSEICKLQNGHGFRPPDWSESGYPIIRIQNLNGNQNFNYFAGTPEQKWLVPPGQILFAWAGTKGASFGPTIWKGPTGVLNQHIFKVFPAKNVDKDWLYIALRHVTDRIEAKAHGFKATLVHVKKSDIDQHSVLLPPLHEQREIAETLATWDRAIETVEALIANARAQKQALMQQLLPHGTSPPKKRLAGFSGEWRTLRIGDVTKEISERAGEEAGYPVLSCSKYDGMVESLTYFKKKVYSDDTSNYKVMRRGTFGFPSNHIEEGSIGYQDLFDAGIVSPIYCVFVTDAQVDDGFLYKLLKTDRYRQIFAAATNASVDRRGSLRWKEFSRIPLPLPPLAEQRAINEAVNAVADVQRGYEAQLTALRQEKAALMQQLLTGKRRVKLPESEVA
ncbi:restriction endonuclease subunit S [Novosphingobium aquimarinum]|uniref:restriction endonuclease subunit S n=1 Tax=Novosphingobium aquimarinum TaxID=2682494 RepID=UPI0012EBAFEE|nr:restriction endonuclease subunit S [Novosphingobium aquimarinum]